MHHSISIAKAAIMLSVATATAYAGAKTPADFDRTATSASDAPLLDAFWLEAARSLSGRLRGYISSVAAGNSSLSLTLALSGSFNPAMLPRVTDGLSSFMTHSIASRWFAITDATLSASHLSLAEAAISDVIGLLSFRPRPRRPAR